MCLACLFEGQRPGQYQHGATPHERWATKGKGLKARSRPTTFQSELQDALREEE